MFVNYNRSLTELGSITELSWFCLIQGIIWATTLILFVTNTGLKT